MRTLLVTACLHVVASGANGVTASHPPGTVAVEHTVSSGGLMLVDISVIRGWCVRVSLVSASKHTVAAAEEG